MAAPLNDADLSAVLASLMGTEPSAELLAAFKADQALMALVNQYGDVLQTQAAIQKAKETASRPAPPRTIPGSGIGGSGLLEKPNPAYTQWQQDQADARKILNDYYEYGLPSGAEKAAYKTLASTATSLQQRISSRMGVVQGAGDKGAATATNPPDLVWLPTGTAGEERAHVYDPAQKTYVPAKDAQGNLIPTRQSTQQTTPRIAEGTQSWELKELNGVWYQVPTRALANGTFELDTVSGRMPQPVKGLPTDQPITVLDGMPYTRNAQGQLVPVPGYVKPPLQHFDARGRGSYSTDNGQTWQPMQGLPGTPQTITANDTVYPLDENGLPLVQRGIRLPPGEQTQVVDGYFVRLDPTTGQLSRTDLYTPEQRARLEETSQVNLATARAGLERQQQLADPMAEYQRQVGVMQQQATQYRDQLNDRILRGEVSVEDAEKQFNTYWGSQVEPRLQPYQTMAESSYRREQNEYQQRQAAEQARVDAVNRERQQLAFQAGEKARTDLMQLAPQARSPEFLNQLAQNVSRIGQPLPGGPGQHGGGMQFSPESLSLDAVNRFAPNIGEVGQAAVARTLAAISPAAAQSIGAPPPKPPGLPQFQNFLSSAPFSIPNPSLPVPGRGALDLGNAGNAALAGVPVQPGYAITQYQGGQWTPPWQIPAA